MKYKNEINFYLIVVIIAFIVILAVAAYERNTIWRDDLSLWEDVVKKSPNKARGYNNRGIANADRGQYNEAINDYSKSIAIISDHSEAYRIYNNRGNVYARKGQYDMAIDDYNKAIYIKPYFTEAYYNRGNAYAEKGQFNLAIDDYNKVIFLNPNFSEAYNNLGIVYFRKGQNDIAVKNFQKACDMGNEMGCKNLYTLVR